jgi:hypothetical protein
MASMPQGCGARAEAGAMGGRGTAASPEPDWRSRGACSGLFPSFPGVEGALFAVVSGPLDDPSGGAGTGSGSQT